jgi:hypothetical protein
MSSLYFRPVLSPNSGFYYRMPISTTLTQDGQILPQYFHLLTIPYFGIIYPIGDQYTGLMIVKTLQQIPSISGVEVLTQFEVYTEVKRIANQEFTL